MEPFSILIPFRMAWDTEIGDSAFGLEIIHDIGPLSSPGTSILVHTVTELGRSVFESSSTSEELSYISSLVLEASGVGEDSSPAGLKGGGIGAGVGRVVSYRSDVDLEGLVNQSIVVVFEGGLDTVERYWFVENIESSPTDEGILTKDTVIHERLGGRFALIHPSERRQALFDIGIQTTVEGC